MVHRLCIISFSVNVANAESGNVSLENNILAGLAQLAERNLCNVDVRRSNRLSGSMATLHAHVNPDSPAVIEAQAMNVFVDWDTDTTDPEPEDFAGDEEIILYPPRLVIVGSYLASAQYAFKTIGSTFVHYYFCHPPQEMEDDSNEDNWSRWEMGMSILFRSTDAPLVCSNVTRAAVRAFHGFCAIDFDSRYMMTHPTFRTFYNGIMAPMHNVGMDNMCIRAPDNHTSPTLHLYLNPKGVESFHLLGLHQGVTEVARALVFALYSLLRGNPVPLDSCSGIYLHTTEAAYNGVLTEMKVKSPKEIRQMLRGFNNVGMTQPWNTAPLFLVKASNFSFCDDFSEEFVSLSASDNIAQLNVSA
jgi:hypothetical protein